MSRKKEVVVEAKKQRQRKGRWGWGGLIRVKVLEKNVKGGKGDEERLLKTEQGRSDIMQSKGVRVQVGVVVI